MSKLRKSFVSDKGGVLVYALMGITLLSALLITAYVVSGQSMSNAVYAQMNAQARYTAEAGLEKAIRQLLDESNHVQALNQAITNDQGIWISREMLAISEVGYTTEYEVIVEEITPSKVYEFTSIAYTNGTRSVELELKKRISFGNQPSSYASSPLFDFAIYTQGVMESNKNSDIKITGGNVLLQGDLATKGDLELTDLTLCVEGKNRHKGDIEKENVIEDCSFPQLDVEDEMAKLYDSLVELSATRSDIYITDRDLTIYEDDIEDGQWVKDDISYSVVIAPNITIKSDEELGTDASPFLMLAGTTEKGKKFKPGIISLEDKLDLDGFVLGKEFQIKPRSDIEFEINGGIIMADKIHLYNGAQINYPELSGGSFTEAFID